MQKITPFLWFDTQAEEAANFYVSVFEKGKITGITRCGENGPGPKGSVLTVSFELRGEAFVALNGGPQFKFDEAISFVINCESQEEIDYFWERLTSDGGEPVQCGWLKDKFGLSWQVVPRKLWDWMQDPAGGPRVLHALMQMEEFDLARLEAAYNAD